MDKISIYLYHSGIAFESRIMKETNSLASLDLAQNIFIVGIQKNNLPEFEELDKVRIIWRVPLAIKAAPFKLVFGTIRSIEWAIRILIKFRSKKVMVVNCGSLITLPIGVVFKFWKKSKLIYDAHELETETFYSRGARKILAKTLERLLIGYADEIIVVSGSIADWYRNKYRLKNIEVVRNIPDINYYRMVKSSDLKMRFNIKDGDLLFIYLGLLSIGRGVELLLEAFTKCHNYRHLVFMGFGPLENMIKEYENGYPNIHFHPPVKAEQIGYYVSGADIGICLGENVCLSYYYSLPNKFFEYLLSGLPVIASDFPEMACLIDKYNCGWKSEVKLDSLVNLINGISLLDVNEKKENVLKCRERFNWKVEEEKLTKIYKKLFYGVK